MSPYNPNGIWTSKENPNFPRSARSQVKPSLRTNDDAAATAPSEPVASATDGAEPSSNETLIVRPPRKQSFFSKYGLWMFGILLILLLAGAVVAMEFLKPPSQPATSVTIAPIQGAAVGVPFMLSVSAVNRSAATLSNAVLAVQLPQGVEFVGSDAATQVQEFPQGNLSPGAVVTQTSSVIVTGNPDTLYALSVKLLYSTPQTPSTTYETDQAASFSAGSSPVSLSYAAPTNIVSGQSFPVTVTYANNGAQEVDDARILLQYPAAFTFSTSTLALATDAGPVTSAAGVWDLGTLAPGQGGSFVITGSLLGGARGQYEFLGTLSTGMAGQRYPVNIQPLNLALVPAPLALSIAANGKSDYISSAGDQISYTLTYTNNSSVTLSSVKITAALSGQMFDPSTVRTAGAFNSKAGIITWYAANTPALASLAPGQSGSVDFSIGIRKTFPIKLPSDKDYSVGVTGIIQSPTVIPGAPGTSTVSAVAFSNKLGGFMAFASKGYWKSGPYPPKVDEPTTYTIDWTVTNYSTDASGTVISAYLQSGSSFLGVASSTGTTSTPSYDPGTGLITWNIPFVPAGTGITDPPMKAEFTISNTPAANQVNSDVTLLGPASLKAQDLWTGGAFSLTADPVTTALPNDNSFGNISRSVTQ